MRGWGVVGQRTLMGGVCALRSLSTRYNMVRAMYYAQQIPACLVTHMYKTALVNSFLKESKQP